MDYLSKPVFITCITLISDTVNMPGLNVRNQNHDMKIIRMYVCLKLFVLLNVIVIGTHLCNTNHLLPLLTDELSVSIQYSNVYLVTSLCCY